MSDLLADAEDRYLACLERRRAIQSEWRGLGSPLLSVGSQGQEVEHPLIAMIRYHDALLMKLALPLRKAHAGPEPSAVIRGFRANRITRLEAVPKAPRKLKRRKAG